MNKKLTKTVSEQKSLYLNILDKNPNDYDTILRLGLIYVKENNLSIAKLKFKQLISIDISKFEGHLNLSNIYILEGKKNKANDVLLNYLNNIDENIEIVNSLAINLLNSGKINDLEKHINKYINKQNNYILYYLKGYLNKEKNNVTQAESYFKKSIHLNMYFWNSYYFLFKQYEKQSKLDKFKKLLDKAKEIFADNLKLYYFESLYLFRIKEYKQSFNILKKKEIERKFLSETNDVDLADYYDLLCKVCEKLGKNNESYTLAIKRNKLILDFKENKNLNRELILKTISAYKAFFDTKNKPKSRISLKGIKHDNLAFIIGFPRSGTTLLDTILRSHTKTLVLEESPYLLNIRHDFFKKNQLSDILKINEKDKIKMQQQYFDSFDYKSNELIIDKYPLNLIELGFIKTLFPDSKIILAIRHPLDCIISCVLTSFKMNEGMINFENIETTAFFYNECFDLLFRYFSYYEIKYHEIKYENVVENFKDEISKLLKFLNLEFEDNIYNFQKTAMKRDKISTPSYNQVIEPLYSSSINRFKKFDEIKNIDVDIKRWIYEFSY